MADVVSPTYQDLLSGTSYQNGMFTGTRDYVYPNYVDFTGGTAVGSAVTLYLNGSSYAATYEGSYVSGGVDYPLVTFGGTYYLSGPSQLTTYAISTTTYVTPCFVTGTFIRTARGEVAVEDLKVGDLAITSSGAERPIRWIGQRTIISRNRIDRTGVWPIRISAHAMGPNKPARDLYVSPGHSICVTVVEDVLIPAAALVNGTTIQQVEVDEVTYWHVELDSHDILFAENLPTESYLEMGNRDFFREGDVVSLNALPDAPCDQPDSSARTHADFCRPFHNDGPIVEAVRSHLQTLRATLGWTLEHKPLADLHLVADGVRIEPTIRELAARFNVPAGANEVWLVSNTARPCEVSESLDTRNLGICVAGLTINDGFGRSQTIALDDPLLCVGFHHLEESVRRWTAGRSRIPAALWADCSEGFFLRVELAGPALPRWVALSETIVERQAA